MTVSWVRGTQNWAFKVITEHYSKAMPQHRHIFNDQAGADVIYVVEPHYLQLVPEKEKIVLHLDSFRMLENEDKE